MAKSLSEEIIDAVGPMTDELTRRIYAHWSARAEQLQASLAESREYRKHVQSHCEHDWTETLHGPDTVGEHCFICGVAREYDDYDYGVEP